MTEKVIFECPTSSSTSLLSIVAMSYLGKANFYYHLWALPILGTASLPIGIDLALCYGVLWHHKLSRR